MRRVRLRLRLTGIHTATLRTLIPIPSNRSTLRRVPTSPSFTGSTDPFIRTIARLLPSRRPIRTTKPRTTSSSRAQSGVKYEQEDRTTVDIISSFGTIAHKQRRRLRSLSPPAGGAGDPFNGANPCGVPSLAAQGAVASPAMPGIGRPGDDGAAYGRASSGPSPTANLVSGERKVLGFILAARVRWTCGPRAFPGFLFFGSQKR